jgi:hypothetical protein
MTVHVAAIERVREVAHSTGMALTLDGLQDGLVACLLLCEGDIARMVSASRAADSRAAPGRLWALARQARGRLLRLLGLWGP